MKEARRVLKREPRQVVNKSSGAIHMENKLSLLQRRTWNAMLYNAYDQLESHDEYQIPLQRLADLVGYDSHDTAYLKDAARAMLHCVVEWNVLDKDGDPHWGATALLAHVSIKRGTCTYGYSTELRRRLHNPAMYARLDLDLQKQFTSQYSLALWELCTDALGAGRDCGKTRFIEIETFRKLMGITGGMYPQFMRLNEKVIKPAIEEVNRVSDFQVTMECKRQGRKVIALKFQMRRIALLPEPSNAQKALFPGPDESLPVIVSELKDAGLSTSDALAVWQQGFAGVEADSRPADPGDDAEAAFLHYIHEKIHLLRRQQATGKVHNSTGFLLEAIKKNYANPEFEQENTRRIAAAAQQAREKQAMQVKALARQKAEIEQARNAALDQLAAQVAEEATFVLDQAAAELLAGASGFQNFYDQSRSALENYQARKLMRAFFNDYLEKHAPERFAAVRQQYTVQLTAVAAQIAALQPVQT